MNDAREAIDIYDRANWPSPDSNPLVILLQRGDEWYSNKEIVAALGLAPKRALISSTADKFSRELGLDDTAISGKWGVIPSGKVNAANSGSLRLFSRKALVLAAMRTNTVNAAAFRDWLATEAADIEVVPALQL